MQDDLRFIIRADKLLNAIASYSFVNIALDCSDHRCEIWELILGVSLLRLLLPLGGFSCQGAYLLGVHQLHGRAL